MSRAGIAGLLALFVGALTVTAAAAAEDKRVALVIGNSAYKHTTPLRNPVNDAGDVADALKRLGFDVIQGMDLDHAGMRRTIRAFTDRIEGADVALFYYAGHGVQVDDKNYLAPISASLARESDLDFETVPLNLVLRQMEREERTNLVFLDACRDNPLAAKLARSMRTRSGAVGRGLARVESGIGTMIAYATAPGSVALDGTGRNSPYTKALLQHIERPGVGIHDLMISVRQDVRAATKGKQVTWEHSSLTGNFVFKPKPQKIAAAPPVKAPPVTPKSLGLSDLEGKKVVATAYQATVAVGTCGAYRAFESQHRGTFYARLAEEWLRTNCTKPARKVVVEPKPTVEAKAPPPATDVKPLAAQSAPPASDPLKGTDEAPSVVAALAPAATAAQPAPEIPTGSALILALQKELDRLGCAPGSIDGKWGGRSRTALKRFYRYAKLSGGALEPSGGVLAALKAKPERICPLECGPQYDAKDGRCVKKICPAGHVLTRRGSCIVRAKPKPPRTVTRKTPRPTARTTPSRRTSPKEDRFWGGEDTRVECERGRITGDCFPQR